MTTGPSRWIGQRTKPVPKISVIIPAYKPANFGGLLASIRSNIDADAEWIVIDDGSGPKYDPAFGELSDTPACVIREPKNRGQSVARNIGLANARGDWVKFLDADDQLSDGHLSTLLGATRQEDKSMIPFASTCHVFSDGRTLVNESWRGLRLQSEAQLSRLLYAPFLHHGGALFPKALLTEVGGYDESLITDEDGDLLIRVLMSGACFLPVEGCHYQYRHHDASGRVSIDVGGHKLGARLRVCDKVEAAFQGCGLPPAIRHGLALRLDKIAMSYWNEDRATARAVLNRARRLYPGYRPMGGWPVRLLRILAGPSAAIRVSRLWRRLRGRPAGGAQA